jgi:hypothetical protein
MRIGIAADHGGFELKGQLTAALDAAGYSVTDFGAHELATGDDYPDFVVPLARAVARGEVTRGLAICGGGVGACVAAYKVPGVRAAFHHGFVLRSSGGRGRRDERNVPGRPGHRTCPILGFGPDVPERPFQGGRTVQAPSCESGGVGKREKVLIEVSEMSAQEFIASARIR